MFSIFYAVRIVGSVSDYWVNPFLAFKMTPF